MSTSYEMMSPFLSSHLNKWNSLLRYDYIIKIETLILLKRIGNKYQNELQMQKQQSISRLSRILFITFTILFEIVYVLPNPPSSSLRQQKMK